MIQVSIVGATGYTGGELIRILLNHPEVSFSHLTSQSFPGKRISEIHAFLKGRLSLTLEELDVAAVAKDSDVVFLGLPHGESARTGAAFFRKGVRVIDLSADFRLKSVSEYRKWYGGAHPAPDLLKKAVYGIPELFRDDIRSARLIANPGCYASAIILSAAPLLKHGMIVSDSLIADAKSGVSGAGKKLQTMFLYSEANENMQAYAVAEHRHLPEIEQALGMIQPKGAAPRLTFVPQLAPMTRGILVTLYASLRKNSSTEKLTELYRRSYHDEPFVAVLPPGESPQVKSVSCTNFFQVGVKVDERLNRVVVMGALDNLTKGASGVAVQNMNLMMGFEETLGLR